MPQLCYVLAYRAPNYIRTRSLLQALNGLDDVNVITAINRPTGWLRYVDTLWQLLKIRIRYNPDCYLLGFRGHEIFWPVKLITLGRPLIFDSLMSPYNALVDEGKYGVIGVVAGQLLYYVEKAILRQADHVLTDTQLHVEYLRKRFGLQSTPVSAVPVGAVELDKRDATAGNGRGRIRNRDAGEDNLNVLYYGSFLPLHGMPVMLEAAARVRDKPIHFTFIGGSGSSVTAFKESVVRLRLDKVSHVDWVPYEHLLESVLSKTDLCLGGPFGNTSQSKRVITGKSSQCLARGKATVIGMIEEDVGLVDEYNCLLVPQGDPQALAARLLWAAENRDRLKEIGARGMALYREKLSIRCIRDRLKEIMQEC